MNEDELGNPAQAGVPAGTFEDRNPQVKPDPVAGAVAPVAKGPQLGEPGAKEPVTPNASTADEFDYAPTGDASLDYFLNFVGKLGYGDTHPAMLAASDGDFSLLKVELATKDVKGADAVVALAEQAHSKHAVLAAAAAEALNTYAHGLVGGADQWGTVLAWASANADPDEKADLNEALAKGGASARRAIKYIVDGYSATNTINKEPASPTKANAGTSAGPAAGPLTAKAYADAVRELQQKARGQDLSDNPEYHRLQAQRLQARRAGH